MKYLLSFFSIISILVILPLSICASEPISNNDDVSEIYIEETISYIDNLNPPWSDIHLKNQVKGSKTYTAYSKDKTKLWSYTLYGDFAKETRTTSLTMNAIGSNEKVNVFNNAWHLKSSKRNTLNNTVSASITFEKSNLNVPIDERSFTINLTCNALGDTNTDKVIDMKDILIIRKHLSRVKTYISLEQADVNLDKEINLRDVLYLRKYLSFIEEIPVVFL